MSPIDRKIALLREGRTMAEIARGLGVTTACVSQVIAGKRRSPRVRRAIADAIGRPVERVFGATEAA